jgi:polyisoprenoid-binding protein YceI
MTSATAIPQTTSTAWNIDPAHSVTEFKVRHMMITNVKGQFSGIKGTLTLADADIAKSRVEASIDAASLNTREPQRDTHLKSADFLDVEKFPTLSFTSSRVSRSGAVFNVEELSAPAKDPWGNTRVGLSATTKIDRKDFGLTWNTALETGGVLVGDQVTITLEVQFVKA